MAYGIIKVDSITFTNGGVDQTVTVSGIVQSISGNITATGTIQGATIIGTSTVSGATVTGNVGVFTAITGDTAGFTTVTGTTVTGTTANFVTVSGATVTGTTADFGGVITAPTIHGTTTVSGATVTGTAGQFTTVTGGSAGFTTVTGATVTGTTANFTTLSGTTITGGHVTTASGTYTGNVTAAAFVPTGSSVPTNGVYLPSANNVAISTNGTGRLFVDASGIVTVNSSSPLGNSIFGVVGSVGSTNFRNTGCEVHFTRNSNNDIYANGGSSAGLQLGANNYLSFLTGTTLTERMRLDSSGRLGLGTSAPDGLLNIAANNDGVSAVSSANNRLRFTDTDTAVASNFQITGAIEFETKDSSSPGVQAYIAAQSSTTGFGNLLLGTGQGGSATTKLFIQSDGAVGIGTIDPLAPFHLKGIDANNTYDATTDSFLITAGGGQNLRLYVDQTNKKAAIQSVEVGTGGKDLLLNPAGGSVGIGTTAPGDYNANADDLVVASAGSTGITIASNSANYGSLFFADGTSGTAEYAGYLEYNHSTDALGFGTGGSERARIDSSGRLLVGTASFTGEASLAIKASSAGSGTQAQLVLQRGQANPAPDLILGVIKFADSDATGHIGAEIAARVDGASSWASGDYPTRLVFSTTADGAASPTERLRITSGGFLCATESGSLKSTSLHNIKATSAQTTFAFYNTNTSSPAGILVNYDSASPNAVGNHFLYCSDSTAQRASIRSNGGLANYQSNNVDLSDERAKRDIAAASSTWDCVQAWEVVNYNYLDDANDDTPRVGVIAQQIQQHCPEVVIPYQEAEDAVLDDDGNVVTPAKEERLGVREQQMMWMAIKALQEAQLRIETLEAEVAALKG